jgi:hypothetical protein
MRYQNALRVCLVLPILCLAPVHAFAQDTVRIAYIDPLSGGGASIGEVGLKTFQFLADEVNAKGDVLGKKLEIVGYDDKVNPQESNVQIQKAIDAGIRIASTGHVGVHRDRQRRRVERAYGLSGRASGSSDDELAIVASVTLRRRGVETKLIIDGPDGPNTPPQPDITLIR